jgi:hypothetical protein
MPAQSGDDGKLAYSFDTSDQPPAETTMLMKILKNARSTSGQCPDNSLM